MLISTFEKNYLHKKVRIALWSKAFEKIVYREGILKRGYVNRHQIDREKGKLINMGYPAYFLEMPLGKIVIKRSEIKYLRKGDIEIL